MQRDTGLIPGSGRSLEEGMATHSSILAWRIPWTEEPGGLQSMGLQRVGHNWSKLAYITSYLDPQNQWLSIHMEFIPYKQGYEDLAWKRSLKKNPH